MKAKHKAGLVAAACCLAMAGWAVKSIAPTAAASPEPAKKTKSWEVSPYLQIDPLIIPLMGHSARSGPVTLVLQVYDRDNVGHICRMLPRVRDAVLRSTHHEPARVVRGRLQTGLLSNQLLSQINKALDSELIEHVLVFPGARPMRSNGSVSKLPFASEGCHSVPESDFETAGGGN